MMSRPLLLLLGWALALLPAACHSQGQTDEDRPGKPGTPTNWASKLADAEQTASVGSTVYSFTISAKVNDDTLAGALTAACAQQAAHVLNFCKPANPLKPSSIPVKVFASIEEKGLALENTQPVQIRWEASRIAVVSSAYFGEAQLGPQNALLLRQLLGEPTTIALEDGLSVYFNPKWQFRGHQHWAGRLFSKGNLPALKDLLDTTQRQAASPLVYRAAVASFTQYLLESWGSVHFLKQYTSWAPKADDLEHLESAWHQWLQPFAPAPPKPVDPLPYLKGFNFAHEGYSVFNGYGSAYSAEALEKQRRLGANAIAIVPYSYMRDPHRPTPLPIMQRAGTETDESVIRDALLAKALKLHVVLKPQIWLGGGQWPGDVEMKTARDWDAFFQHYYRWMRHYALLAEIYEIEMLCVGVEFAKATQQQPEQWVALIDKLRGIFSGPMTYAANWGTEFEALPFWEHLDYIGLDCYYPLSQAGQPTDSELLQAFAKKLDLAKAICQRANRPLLFTEIGFTSTPTPWQSPHRDGRGKPYDGQAQRRCYAICMSAIAESGDWLQGLLWWKFPSDLSEGGAKHTGFTPNNKPAEQTLSKWFRKLP